MKHLGTIEMETERLKLRKLKKEDAYELYEGLRNQEEFLYYTHREKVTLEEQIKSLENIDEKYKSLDYYNWVITQKSDNKIVGMINLRVMDIIECVEFSYAIDNRYTKRGYMSEALKKIIEFAMEKMVVNRIQGGCCVSNIASKKVIEKCGLEYEGTLKNYLILKDGYHDMHLYSLINKNRG